MDKVVSSIGKKGNCASSASFLALPFDFVADSLLCILSLLRFDEQVLTAASSAVKPLTVERTLSK
jgi:hypothetical protein